MAASLKIENRCVGPGHPTLIVAELSANHHQDLQRAVQLVRAAHRAGADAVKLQTYTADTMTIRCHQQSFQIKGGTIWDGECLYDLYNKAHTPWHWHEPLQSLATDLGLIFFSTPFDATAVDFLEGLRVPAYKVASFEIVDIPLLERVASTGKPVIVSTGMASLAEIELAVAALTARGCQQYALLKCTSAYPAPPSSMNLRTIPHLASTFGCVSGLSDHTLGTAAAVTSVALGGSIIEKHLTLSRAAQGPDSPFSLEPHEFEAMVRQVRIAEAAIGEISYGVSCHEQSSAAFRRSLFVVQDIRAGETFSSHNVRSIRPGNGLPPKYYDRVQGRLAATDISRGTPLSWKHVA